jgi:hypothetical protein
VSAPRAFPNGREAVERIPHSLCSPPNFIGTHRRVRNVQLRAPLSGDQPVSGNRNAFHPLDVLAEALFQRSKSTVPGNGVIMTNCAKVSSASLASVAVASKVASRLIPSRPECAAVHEPHLADIVARILQS